MGVGIQGESGGEVAEHSADGFDIHAVLQGNGGEGVAEIVKSDLGNPGSGEDSFEHIVHAVRGDGASIWGWEHILVVGLGSLPFQNFYCLWRDRHRAVGVLCFQRCFHDLAVHSGNLPPHLDDGVLPVDVLPLQPQQLAPPQAGGQFNVVHLVDACGLGFGEESL